MLVHPKVFVEGHTGPGLPIREGARIGTSAARRRALLAHLNPQLNGVDLRGQCTDANREMHPGDSRTP